MQFDLATTPDLLNAIYALDPFQDPMFWWPIGQFPCEVEEINLLDRLAGFR